jgi:hypothetical protein
LTPFSTRYAYRLPGQRGKASQALGQPDAVATREALEVLLGQLAVWEVCEAEAQAAEAAAAAVETAPPAAPPVAPESRPGEVLRAAGANPYQVARRLGVSEEKLRRAAVRLRKATTGRRAAPEVRAWMATREDQLAYMALLDLRPPAEVGDMIGRMALEALERRDQALARAIRAPAA